MATDPHNEGIEQVRIVDANDNPARVSLIAGVWRLAVDAVFGGGGGVAQTGAFDSGVADETSIGMYVRSGTTGLHGGLAANARNVPIEARAPGTAYLDERLYGLYSLAHVRGIDGDQAVGSQSVPIGARLPSNISGELSTVFDVLGTMAVVTGIDLSAGSLLRTVEARTLANWDASPETSPVLGTAAILHGRDVGAADYSRIMADLIANVSGRSAAGVAVRGIYANAINIGVDNQGAAVFRPVEVTGAASVSASALEAAYSLLINQSRESGFDAARRGRRFYTTNSSMYSYGTLLAAQTTFVGTTPTLLLRVSSAAIRAVIRQISLAIGNTPGGVVYIAVHLSTTDRYASGGIQSTPSNTNEESATPAVVGVYQNPVATASSVATTRPLCSTLAPATPGTTIQISFADGVLLGPTAASLLVYVWAASTAPQILWSTEHEEVA